MKHGHARSGNKSDEYRIWCAIRERCNYQKHIEYHRYGAVGIKVAERWNDFANFLADMGNRPSSKHSIDRHPNGCGNYEPGNCRWATPSEQQRNKSTSINLTFNGETLHILEWARRLNLSLNTIRKRLRETRDPTLVLRPSRQAPRNLP